MNLGPCILAGHVVRLEPPHLSHREGLLAAQATDNWVWMPMNLRNPEELDVWMAKERRQVGK